MLASVISSACCSPKNWQTDGTKTASNPLLDALPDFCLIVIFRRISHH